MPRTDYEGDCYFCHEPVYRGYGACYGVVGWEPHRGGAGGANHILMRTRVPNTVAHPQCVNRAATLKKKGIALDQETLDFG